MISYMCFNKNKIEIYNTGLTQIEGVVFYYNKKRLTVIVNGRTLLDTIVKDDDFRIEVYKDE